VKKEVFEEEVANKEGFSVNYDSPSSEKLTFPFYEKLNIIWRGLLRLRNIQELLVFINITSRSVLKDTLSSKEYMHMRCALIFISRTYERLQLTSTNGLELIKDVEKISASPLVDLQVMSKSVLSCLKRRQPFWEKDDVGTAQVIKEKVGSSGGKVRVKQPGSSSASKRSSSSTSSAATNAPTTSATSSSTTAIVTPSFSSNTDVNSGNVASSINVASSRNIVLSGHNNDISRSSRQQEEEEGEEYEDGASMRQAAIPMAMPHIKPPIPPGVPPAMIPPPPRGPPPIPPPPPATSPPAVRVAPGLDEKLIPGINHFSYAENSILKNNQPTISCKQFRSKELALGSTLAVVPRRVVLERENFLRQISVTAAVIRPFLASLHRYQDHIPLPREIGKTLIL
jgi:hypothetical protein